MAELERIFRISMIIAVGAPGVGALLCGQWLLAVLLCAAGALWLRSRWGLLLCLGGLLAAVWLEVGMGWLLVGMVAALAAWDVDAFHSQLTVAPRVKNETRLIEDHLRCLLWVSLAGLLMGGVGLFLRVSLSFILALSVALLAVFGLAVVVRHLSSVDKPHVPPTP